MASGARTAAVALVAGVIVGLVAGWALRGELDAAAPEDLATAGDVPATKKPAATKVFPPRTPRVRAPQPSGDDATSATPTARAPGAAPPPRSSTRADDAPRPGPSDRAAGAPDAGATSTAPAHPATGSADAPRDDAPSGPDAAMPRAAEPPAREAIGIVLDAVTQRPIAGARVLYAFADGPRAGNWWGATSGPDGRFHSVVNDDTGLAEAHLEVRVAKEGYEPARVPAAAGEYRIELRPRTTPPMPGRIVGVARTSDGKPFSGELEVEGYDDIGGNAAQRTVADAGGAFVLEGVPPGHWRLHWNGARAEVTLPDAGEARVELAAPEGGDRSGFAVTDIDPSKVVLDDAKAQAQVVALRKMLDQVAQAPDLTPATRERVSRTVALEIQRLAAAALFALPRRDVVVTGIATDGRAWMRLAVKPRQFWRVEVTGGAARFPPVPPGAYTAVLVEPGKPECTTVVVVGKGEGAFEIEFR